eukprot:Rhum_TRINITY_DN4194_c0_g1::Rhum_TRINITY_DN4194_c0_g1_i1::g.13240::m.13240
MRWFRCRRAAAYAICRRTSCDGGKSGSSTRSSSATTRGRGKYAQAGSGAPWKSSRVARCSPHGLWNSSRLRPSPTDWNAGTRSSCASSKPSPGKHAKQSRHTCSMRATLLAVPSTDRTTPATQARDVVGCRRSSDVMASHASPSRKTDIGSSASVHAASAGCPAPPSLSRRSMRTTSSTLPSPTLRSRRFVTFRLSGIRARRLSRAPPACPWSGGAEAAEAETETEAAAGGCSALPAVPPSGRVFFLLALLPAGAADPVADGFFEGAAAAAVGLRAVRAAARVRLPACIYMGGGGRRASTAHCRGQPQQKN